MYARLLKPSKSSFFLFGPRGTGKSTWIKQNYPDATIIDLLPPSESLKFSKDPSNLSRIVRAYPKNHWIVIDEIQKVPELLDEVHHLMENEKYKNFVLSGSSVRKLKRGGANLLAGRAKNRAMFPLTSFETHFSVPVEQVLRYGLLPLSVVAGSDEDREDFLRSYLTTYLNEEIKAEGIVRNIGDFSRFIDVATLASGTRPNFSGLARDAGIGRDTVQSYFSAFEDTLLGSWLPAYRPRAKIKEVASPKFYWFDPGVLHVAAGGFDQPMPRDWYGTLLETWIHAELRAFLHYSQTKGKLSYWATSANEVDFVWSYGDRKIVAIEVKSGKTFRREYLKGLRSLGESLKLHSKYLVYLGNDRLKEGDVDILPVQMFLKELHSGRII